MNYLRKTLLVLTCLTLMMSVGPAWSKTYKFDMANEYAPTSIHGENDTFFIQTLEKLSGGRIKITHHPGASLGYKSKDQFDAVTDGALPIADTYVGPLRGIHPIFLLSSLPFMAKTIDDAKVLWTVSVPYYEKVLKDSNQILLYASPWPPSGCSTTRSSPTCGWPMAATPWPARQWPRSTARPASCSPASARPSTSSAACAASPP